MNLRSSVSPLLPLLLLLGSFPPAGALAQAAPPPTEVEIWMQDVAVSPDGRTLAFSRYEGVGEYTDERWQVWVADRDGGNARPVIPSADYVSFSPDGKRLVTGQVIDGDWEVVTARTDGSDLRRLTTRKGDDMVPSWSPDGRWIVYSASVDGNIDLYRMRAEGGEPERLTTDPAGDYNAVYSADGKQLLFYREKGDQQDQVWTLDLEKRTERRITDGTGHHFFPFYLPDGRMAWSGQPGPKDSKSPRRLWIRETSGKLEPVGPENVFFARVSPDGKEILYLLRDSGERRIYRLPLSGGEPSTVVDGRKLSAPPSPSKLPLAAPAAPGR